MLNILLICLGCIFLFFGLLGCFVYKIPGPILSFIGILILQFGTEWCPFSTMSIIICAIAVILCKILEKKSPKLISKIYPFGKGGKIGSMIGSILGLIFIVSTSNVESTALIITMIIVGLLVIPYILSVLGELIAKKNFSISIKSGTAAWTNYLINTLLQLSVSVYCIYSVFNSIGD